MGDEGGRGGGEEGGDNDWFLLRRCRRLDGTTMKPAVVEGVEEVVVEGEVVERVEGLVLRVKSSRVAVFMSRFVLVVERLKLDEGEGASSMLMLVEGEGEEEDFISSSSVEGVVGTSGVVERGANGLVRDGVKVWEGREEVSGVEGGVDGVESVD